MCDATCDVEALQRSALPDSTLLKQVTKCSHEWTSAHTNKVGRRLHSTASAASSSRCRCGRGFRPCTRFICRRLASSLTSSQMLNLLLSRNFNVVTLLPCLFVSASAVMLSGTRRRLARKACMLRRNAQSSSAERRP